MKRSNRPLHGATFFYTVDGAEVTVNPKPRDGMTAVEFLRALAKSVTRHADELEPWTFCTCGNIITLGKGPVTNRMVDLEHPACGREPARYGILEAANDHRA